MNKIRNVLIFPAGTEIGLEIFNSLKDCKEVKIFGASQNEPNHAEYIFDSYHILPRIDQSNFIYELKQLVNELHIEYIFPAYDDVIVKLAKHRDEISAKILAPGIEVCDILRSKSRTYHFFKGLIQVPHVFDSIESIYHFPVFLKPDRGQGSAGVEIIQNKTQLERMGIPSKEILITEFLPGEEYTIDCFSDRERGLLFSSARERRRIRNGISVNTRVTQLVGIEEIAKTISDALGMRGAWFFQVKRASDGRLTLLEIAPRIAGSMALNRVHGVNFPLLTIFEEERCDLSILKNDVNISLDRALVNRYKHDIYFDTVYIDLDDMIIIRGKLNTDLIALLYEMVSDCKKIILLTRHKGNIKELLVKHRILSLFDEIIHVNDSQKKSEFITEKNAIFFDDSFSERLDVNSRTGILTFDVSMVELLKNGMYEKDF